ncbi:hypothetical protein TEA_010714 [Camellia sinensis var. sinensis]|uniref:RRM domain-containing protein n=1 Tax=Camellia sinensis var. sinensis TaxID=542762 RepID=A0A4S4DNC7_CAMSN|nr:hypothetical protein TEA_010714 [Camellia sinensis var. sinensis]
MDETLNSSEPQPSDDPMDEAEPLPSLSKSQNPKPTSDTDSDSDDSDSGDESQQTLQIETLETELSNNPVNYDSHVQYIRVLRKKGDIEKLRKAREAMSELFPLSPAMWQEWAKDETSLSSGPESFPAIEKLYERGVYNYLSVSLWCDYLNFVQEHDPSVRECSAVGILKARNLFERALPGAGLHVAEGHKIWEAYREFEQAIFFAIDETDVEGREKQVQRIRSIFHRQLSVPHSDLRPTLLAYKAWEAEQGNVLDASSSDLDGISAHVASAYQKALEMLNARVHFEEQISKKDIPDMERLQEYMAYLKFEQSFGDPARVQILYERAVTEFPISNDLWLDYTRYLDKTLKASSIVREAYSRATKNCPWIGELWVRYLLCLERGRAPEKEIAAAFEKSLLCTFSSFDEYLDIFLTRVDGLRRRIARAGEVGDALDYTLIRETFQRASDYLSPHLKGTDGLLRMHSYWARLESNLGKDLVAARGVWESLLKISGSMLEAWQGYIVMEIETGYINEARSLYRRCYSKRFPGTGSEDICHSWLRFEREFGTLEDLDHAIQKVTPRLEELQMFRLQQENKSIGTMANQRETLSKKIAREKRKQRPNIADEQRTTKRKKDIDPNITKATYEDLRAFFSDVGGVVAIRILKDKYTGKSRGLAYVDFSDDVHLTAALAKNKQMFLNKKLSIARSDPKQRRMRESVGRNTPMEHGEMSGHTNGQTNTVGESDSKDSSDVSNATLAAQPQSAYRRHAVENVQLKGKNTFAVPRNVRPLGWTDKNKQKTEEAPEGEDQTPKSNDEFRKMFLKS